LQAQGRDIVWIAPPHVPYAPALASGGLDLARFLVVRCSSPADQLWAYEQALRAPECGAAFAWLGQHDDRVLRRLAVAAREGRTWGVLWRRPGQLAVAAVAPLRLALATQQRRLAVYVLKRRGGDLARPVYIDIDVDADIRRLSFSGDETRPPVNALRAPGVPPGIALREEPSSLRSPPLQSTERRSS